MAKVVVAVLALLAAGYFYFSNAPSNTLSNSIPFACVETGEVFYLARSEMPSVLPAKNPSTNNRTLLPAEVRGEQVFLVERYAEMLNSEQLKGLVKRVDLTTFEIRS